MSLIASVQATPGPNGGTTGAIDTTGATLLVMHIASFVAVSSVSDSKGNTWTALTSYENTNGRCSRIFYAKNPTVGTGHTFTASVTGSYPAIVAAAYSGIDTTSPLDSETGDSSLPAVATLQPGSRTPVGNNELFVSGFCANLNAVPSIGSSFTLRQSTATGSANNLEAGFADKIQTTGGAENPTWTVDGNSPGTIDPCACSLALFKPAAPPPPTGWGQRLAGERNRRVRGL